MIKNSHYRVRFQVCCGHWLFLRHESHHPVVFNRTLHHVLRLVEMYLIQSATSNATARGILASPPQISCMPGETYYKTLSISSFDIYRSAFDGQLVRVVNRYKMRSISSFGIYRSAFDGQLVRVFNRYKTLSISFFGIYRYAFDRWIARRSRQVIAALWRALRITDLLHSIHLIFLPILKLCGIALATAISVTIIVHIGYWGMPKRLEIYSEIRIRRLEERRQNEERERLAAYQSELFAKQAAEAREHQAIEDKLKRNEEKRQKKAKADYVSWEKECDSFFRNKASMTKFPFPPLPQCTDSDCPGFLKIPVPACQHNVEQFFKESGKCSLDFLKRQRCRWREDRFASCPADRLPEFRRLANSLFVVLDPWYEALKGEQANSSSVR